MNSSVARQQSPKKEQFWWTFPFHQLLSTIGILVIAGFITFAVSSTARARWILTGNPFFPVQILTAFLIGLVLQWYLHHRTMEWVWVLPLLALCISIGYTPLPFHARLEEYFGWACRPNFHCFVQLALTLPFYTAVSYSFAAFLSGRLSQKFEKT